MRNFYFLLLSLLVFPLVKAQFTESFESGIPASWTVINNQSANTWVAGQPTDELGVAVPSHDGAQSAIINLNFTNGHDDYLVTPAIAVVQGTNGFVSFWARNASSSFTDLFDVKLSTTGTAATDFTVSLASNITPPTAWTKYEYNLNGYNGQTVYLAIHSRSQANNQQLAIDLVENHAGPNCPNVSNIAVTQNTGDTVTLNWTNGSSESMWDIEYGAPGFTQGTGTMLSATTNPYTVTGLTANTEYCFYIRANCGTEQSTWEGPYCVTTIINYCAGSPFTDSGGATANYQNNENLNWTIAPINTGDRVRVTFTAYNTENNFDFLRAYNGPDNTYPALHTGNGFTGTNIPPTLVATNPNGVIYFEFTSDGSVAAAGWVANVVCEPTPTCPDISALTSSGITGTTATLGWTAGAGQTSWVIEYGPTGFTPGTGTTVAATSNPFEIIKAFL